MTHMKIMPACAVLMLMISGAARAAERTGKSIKLPDDNAMATLKPGAGVEAATANCMICHSTDYIVRQPGSDARHWDAEVKKMVTVFGAPISDADVKVIVDYLASAYGPKPAAEITPPKKTQVVPGRSKGRKR